MLIPFDYLFEKYKIDATGVLHVGASTGQEAEAYYKNGIQRSIWIEAIPEVYEILKANLKKFKNAIALLACVSDKNSEQVVFHIANNEGQSSSFLDFGTHSKEHSTVKFTEDRIMSTLRIDTLLSFNGIIPQFFTFLNIDLQGAELLALKGMGRYLSYIKYAYIEVNQRELYVNCPMIEEIDQYLLEYDLKRVETYMTKHWWGDAFYIKDSFLM